MITVISDWLKKYTLLIFQLLATGIFIHHFNIEVQFNLPLLFPLVIAAFIVHSTTPYHYKWAVFILSSIIGLMMILPIMEVFILTGLIFLMVAICNLRIALSLKKSLIIVIGTGLALSRMGLFPQWIASQTLVLASSIFMFRMLLFLYELKYQKKVVPLQTQVSYFLMLPNLIFPLFPVVDFKLFQQNYYNTTDTVIYQRGIGLIAKGVLHMFLYRVVYSFLLPSVDEVNSLADIGLYLTFSYLLVIRLSGLFHFSVGVLCLFGYNLPEIFKNLFLASSFSDLWRRMNIYWKDFIIKVFFNPLYFRLKKYGAKRAIFWATIASFVITMLLHSYQTFWLVGVFNVTKQDMVFWLFFGVMVALGSLMNPGPKRSEASLYTSIIQAGKILLTFTAMALAWTFWSTTNFADWTRLIAVIRATSIQEIIYSILSIFLLISAGGSLLHLSNQKTKTLGFAQRFSKIPAALLLLIPLLISFNSLTLERFWNERVNGDEIHQLFHFRLNQKDSQDQVAGYYDNILATSDLMSPLVDNDVSRSKLFQVNLYQRKIVVKSNDAYKRKLTPLAETTIQGIKVSINKWGMYDKYYEQEPAEGTYRIAVMGGSIEMGWAMDSNQSLEQVIEKKLNNGNQHNNYEVLNFSVPSRSVLNHRYALREQVLAFKPDMVVFFDHDETEWINIINSLKEYDYSQDFNGYIDSLYLPKTNTFIEPTDAFLTGMERHRELLMRSIYEDIYQHCTANGIKPVLIAMPELRREAYERRYNHPEIAEKAGLKMIDLSTLFDLEKVASYAMDRGGHPTPEANQLITKAIYEKLIKVIPQNAD